MIVNFENWPRMYGKECRQTLLSVQHVKIGFTSSLMLCVQRRKKGTDGRKSSRPPI